MQKQSLLLWLNIGWAVALRPTGSSFSCRRMWPMDAFVRVNAQTLGRSGVSDGSRVGRSLGQEA
jgi:hypothetical protein